MDLDYSAQLDKVFRRMRMEYDAEEHVSEMPPLGDGDPSIDELARRTSHPTHKMVDPAYTAAWSAAISNVFSGTYTAVGVLARAWFAPSVAMVAFGKAMEKLVERHLSQSGAVSTVRGIPQREPLLIFADDNSEPP
jgi:hypothetical protein